MPSLEKANVHTISNALSRLKKTKDKVVMDGMYGLMNAALDYLHEAHDMHHPGMAHETESDTLGWALVYNGSLTLNQLSNEAQVFARVGTNVHPHGCSCSAEVAGHS